MSESAKGGAPVAGLALSTDKKCKNIPYELCNLRKGKISS